MNDFGDIEKCKDCGAELALGVRMCPVCKRLIGGPRFHDGPPIPHRVRRDTVLLITCAIAIYCWPLIKHASAHMAAYWWAYTPLAGAGVFLAVVFRRYLFS